MQRPVLVTAPAELPVTLAEAKAECRVWHGDEDAMIERYVRAATAHLDGWSGILGRCLMTQRWRATFDAWAPCLRLPFTNLDNVAVVHGEGDADVSVSFVLREDSIGPWLDPVAGFGYPALAGRGAIRVEFDAGFGGAADVPATLKTAILMHVRQMYDADGDEKEPFGYRALIDPYRRVTP